MLSDTETQRPRIQSIGRGLAVLFAVGRSERGLQAKDIVRELGLDRQIVYHILQSLSATGVITKLANGHYILGLRIAELIDSFQRQLAPPERLGPVVRALAQQTGEMSYAVGWVQGKIVALSAITGTKPVGVGDVPQGYASHAHARASGKLLLALAPPAELEDYLARHELTALTPATITTRSEFLRELDRVRESRVSIDHEEFVPGVCCIAVPIGEGRSRYALAVSVPVGRFETHRTEYLAILQRLAKTDDGGIVII